MTNTTNSAISVEKITSHHAPAAIGTYSHAIAVSNANKIIYLSGQIGLDPKTGVLVSSDFSEQAHQVFKNIQSVCRAANGDLQNIIKLTFYLIDLKHFATLNAIMSHYFAEPFPARSTIEVKGLPKYAIIEVDAIMAL